MKKTGFWQDFKKFITRGNVVDMAVGVVIGGSFSKIVSGLVNYIINPFVGLFVRDGDLGSIKTVITPAVVDAETGAVTTAEVAILWGTWFQTILDFIITALCIFTVLRILMRAKNVIEADKIEAAERAAREEEEKKKKEKAEADAAAAEAQRLAEEKQAHFEVSVMRQEELLQEICDRLKEMQR